MVASVALFKTLGSGWNGTTIPLVASRIDSYHRLVATLTKGQRHRFNLCIRMTIFLHRPS
jgi:hypothetical protein